jgi:hypothetical protein
MTPDEAVALLRNQVVVLGSPERAPMTAEALRVLLAELDQYRLLKAAVNAEKCDDPEHGDNCACSFHRMLEAAEQRAETAEALLGKIHEAIGEDAASDDESLPDVIAKLVLEPYRAIVKGVHGALTDAATVVVPGSLEADLYAPVMQIVSERDALRKALLEVHGTEPSLNFTNGKPVDYCPLCDDGTWPCKVALLLDPTPEGRGP